MRSAVSTPPGAQTLEILLFTMIAPSAGDSASRLRPTMTGAPGKAFLVNIAANPAPAASGWSSAMSVSAIFAGLGASTGVKSKRAVPTRNPRGSAAWEASHARCSAREEKVRSVLGTRLQLARRPVE